jgi:hypothetical protein
MFLPISSKVQRNKSVSVHCRGQAAAIEALPFWRKAQEEALRSLPHNSLGSFLSMLQALEGAGSLKSQKEPKSA